MVVMQKAPRYRSVNVGKVLDEKLLRRDWLAREIGVHPSLIPHIISGRRTVDGSRAGQIADALGEPIFLLFELSDDTESVSNGKAA